jgi:tetratricopeptide (TPR) repeat protein
MRAIVFLAFVSTLSLAACKSESSSERAGASSAARCTEEAPQIDASLLAFLSKARAVHLQADLVEGEGKLEEAAKLLAALVRAPAPGGEAPGPEVREVLADALARLAELEGRLGEFDSARGHVRQGLELAKEPTQFRGRLFEVRGAVEKRAYEALVAKGDELGANAAKARALEALKEAVSIQESVIDGALGGTKR